MIRPGALLAAAAGALRYRFFLTAGIFPYLLGAAVAYHVTGLADWRTLLAGMAGVIAVSVGIEGMNEYFDARIGGDRVFAAAERVKVGWHLPVGIAGFGVAFLIGVYLTALRGWPILALALAGGCAALSYLIPPVQLSYRGFGETVITLSYGFGLTLGSYYLQTGRLSWLCVWAALLPVLLILAMTLANEVPDYYGDRLVGKRNIVVRIGRAGAVRLYAIVTGLCFGLLLIGLLAGLYPPLLALAFLLAPLALVNGRTAWKHYAAPARFGGVIRGAILQYVLITLLAIVSYVCGG